MEDLDPPDPGEGDKNYSNTSISTILLEKEDQEFQRKIDSKPDLDGILLGPNPDLNEIAVLNPAIPQIDGWLKPFLSRTELPNLDPDPNSKESIKKMKYAIKHGVKYPFGRHSVIDLRWLKSPTEFTDNKKTTIIFPEHDYERCGCEDPRITKNLITYVAFDGTNARVALATTKDFKTIKKHGIISPQIPLDKCIDLVDDDDYKKIWTKELKEHEKYLKKNPDSTNPKTLFPMDKDAFIYKNDKWELFHRLGNYLQISRANNLRDFKENAYWEDQLRNITKTTVLKNKSKRFNKKWASEKIGWGSQMLEIGDKDVVLWHGVEKENGEYKYYGSFLEIKNGKIVSIIKDPLFKPISNDNFKYLDNGEKKSKKVIFPTAAIVDKDTRDLWVYAGSGDKQIKYRSTDIDWLYKELNQPDNRIINEDLKG